jgi:hypothetical protein
LRTLLPGAQVDIQPGIDLRRINDVDLFKSGILSSSGVTTINEGRRDHWNLNSKGGIGLAQSVRLALKKGTNPLLLLEDDFEISDEQTFRRDLDTLLANSKSFDLAVFGVRYQGNYDRLKPVEFMDPRWKQLDRGKFWHTHCVLFTPGGRRELYEFFNRRPLDMQIDGYYSFLAEYGMLKVLINDDGTVRQSLHWSDIQTDICWVCDIEKILSLLVLITLFVLAYLAYGQKNMSGQTINIECQRRKTHW